MNFALSDNDELSIVIHDFNKLFPKDFLDKSGIDDVLYSGRNSAFTFESEFISTIKSMSSVELSGDSLKQTTLKGGKNQSAKDADAFETFDPSFTMTHRFMTGYLNHLLLTYRFILGKRNMRKEHGGWDNNIGDISLIYRGIFYTQITTYRMVTLNNVEKVDFSFDGSTDQTDFTVTYGFGDMELSVNNNDEPLNLFF